MPLKNNWVNGDIVNGSDLNAVADQVNSNTTSIGSIAALPAQAGQAGKFLGTNGTTASWGPVVAPETHALAAKAAPIDADEFALVDTAASNVGKKATLAQMKTAVVTSATVDGAGAVMNSDISTASMSFVIGENNMVSNSATKVPTQQSVKAYVDSVGVGGGVGGLTLIDNADGTGSVTNASVVDNSDGTGTAGGTTVVGSSLLPESFGAVGNGSTNDASALNACFAAAANATVFLNPAKIYAHSSPLTIGANNCRITGGGTLKATNFATSQSSVKVTGSGITMENVKLTCAATVRGSFEDDHKLVNYGDRNTFRRVDITGSVAAGMFQWGATNFVVEDCTATATLADSFTNTLGASHGRYVNCTAYNSGDDSFSILSYQSDPAPVSDLSYVGCRSFTSQARAFSCIGGQYITHNGFLADSPVSAGCYVGPDQAGFRTNNYVSFTGGTLINCNTSLAPGHYGSILVNAVGANVTNVNFDSIVIRKSNPAAAWTLGVTASNAVNVDQVWFSNISIAESQTAFQNHHFGSGTITHIYQTNVSYDGA